MMQSGNGCDTVEWGFAMGVTGKRKNVTRQRRRKAARAASRPEVAASHGQMRPWNSADAGGSPHSRHAVRPEQPIGRPSSLRQNANAGELPQERHSGPEPPISSSLNQRAALMTTAASRQAAAHHGQHDEWLIDTGASHHLTGMDIGPLKPDITRLKSAGGPLSVEGRGDVGCLTNVLVSRKQHFNLMSVSQFLRESIATDAVIFTKGNVYAAQFARDSSKPLNFGKYIHLGHAAKKLYRLHPRLMRDSAGLTLATIEGEEQSLPGAVSERDEPLPDRRTSDPSRPAGVSHDEWQLVTKRRLRCKYSTQHRELDLWHKRMFHISDQRIKDLAKSGKLPGIDPAAAATWAGTANCEACMFGKFRPPGRRGTGLRHHYPNGAVNHSGSRARTTRVGQLIHSDIWGPSRVPTLRGNYRYWVTFIDDLTKRKWLYLLLERKHVVTAFKQFVHDIASASQSSRVMYVMCNNYCPYVESVRTDNAGEYVGYKSPFATYLRENGINHEFSVPHVHHQNGIAEKANLEIANGVRCALAQANLDRRFWGYAATAFVHADNHSPHKGLPKGKTPMSMWQEIYPGVVQFPTIDMLKPFGCEVFNHLPKDQRTDSDKIARVSNKGLLVGYAPGMRGWKIYFPSSNKTLFRYNLAFNEHMARPSDVEVSKNGKITRFRMTSDATESPTHPHPIRALEGTKESVLGQRVAATGVLPAHSDKGSVLGRARRPVAAAERKESVLGPVARPRLGGPRSSHPAAGAGGVGHSPESDTKQRTDQEGLWMQDGQKEPPNLPSPQDEAGENDGEARASQERHNHRPARAGTRSADYTPNKGAAIDTEPPIATGREADDEDKPPEDSSTAQWKDQPADETDITLGLLIKKAFIDPKSGTSTNFTGKVIGVDLEKEPPHRFLYRVKYEDEDEEDLDAKEIRAGSALYQSLNGDTTAAVAALHTSKRRWETATKSDRKSRPTSHTWVKTPWAKSNSWKTAQKMFPSTIGWGTANAIEGLASDVPTPKNLRSALNSKLSGDWLKAIKKEFQVMFDFDVWEVAPRSACKSRPISTTWVFKAKPNADGTVERLKARLCARGFLQRYGTDFLGTFAPVARLSTIRLQVALSTRFNLKMTHLDFKSAFLQGELDVELHAELPDGWEILRDMFKDQRGITLREDSVLRLKRGIYGLKQAGRIWYKRMAKGLTKLGFIRSPSDNCLFYMMNKDMTDVIFITTWVDDCIVSYNNPTTWRKVLKKICKEFTLGAGVDFEWCLGMAVTRDLEKGRTCLHQSLYVHNLLKTFEMGDCHPVRTPADSNVTLSKDMSPTTEEDKQSMGNIPYRSLLGALLHLANFTRPDISLAVGICARYANCFGCEHWKALKRIVRYLKGTIGPETQLSPGLVYRRYNYRRYKQLGVPIVGYADSDYARCPDTRKSTLGYVFLAAGGPTQWESSKQKIVATSTAEAEYTALAEAVKEAIWIKKILHDLRLPIKSIALHEDNQACIKIAENPVFHKRTKHIDVRAHLVRHHLEAGNISIPYVNTEDQLADMLTKPLAKFPFERNASRLLQWPHRDRPWNNSPTGHAMMIQSAPTRRPPTCAICDRQCSYSNRQRSYHPHCSITCAILGGSGKRECSRPGCENLRAEHGVCNDLIIHYDFCSLRCVTAHDDLHIAALHGETVSFGAPFAGVSTFSGLHLIPGTLRLLRGAVGASAETVGARHSSPTSSVAEEAVGASAGTVGVRHPSPTPGVTTVSQSSPSNGELLQDRGAASYPPAARQLRMSLSLHLPDGRGSAPSSGSDRELASQVEDGHSS